MNTFSLIAIFVCLAAVLGVLFFGLYAMMRGGEFGRKWSNKLMQMRVLLQAGAIGVMMLVVYLAKR
jgi:hypothetical protein